MGPHSADPLPLLRAYGILLGGIQTKGGIQYSTQLQEKLNGIAVYRLHGTSAQSQGATVELSIDQANPIIRQVEMGDGARRTGLKTTLLSFAFDKLIPASKFKLTLPKGAKEMDRKNVAK